MPAKAHRILAPVCTASLLLLASFDVNAQATPDIPLDRPPAETQPEDEDDADDPLAPEAPSEAAEVPAPEPAREAPAPAASVAPAEPVEAEAPRRRAEARVSPSITGETGLLRVASAEGAPAKSVRLVFGLDFFSTSGLFREGDSASRVGGILGVAVAPIEHLELWLNTRASSSRSSLTRPELLQTLGDISLGAKGYYGLFDGSFTLGADLQLTLLTGIGSQSFDFGSTLFQARLLATGDFQKSSLDLPLKVHFNFGGIVDGSDNLSGEVLSDAERFAHGSSEFHRLTAGIALEVPVKYVTPYLEYSMEIPLGYLATPGIVLVGATSSGLQAQQAGGNSVANTAARPPMQRVMPQRITPGLRVTAVPDLTIDLAVDIGLTPDRGPGVLAVPPYNVFLFFSYALDPFADRGVSGPPLAVPVIVPEPTVTEPPPSSGLVTGVVMNSADGKVIEGVVVTFDRAPPVATANNGRFLSHEIEPGPVKIVAKKEGFEPASTDLEVAIGQTQELKLTLVPAIREGSIRGRLTDAQGNAVTGASIEARGPSTMRFSSGAGGAFEQALPEGDYVVVVDASGFYRTGKQVKIEKGKAIDLELRVKPRATPAMAEVAGGRIKLRRRIAFARDNTLAPQAGDVLDAVADLLWARPDLKVRVEAHSDNSAGETAAMRNTQQQAEAVVGYLTAQGIAPERLAAAGIGSGRPIAPNMTARGREQNRRVELLVQE